MLLLPNCGKMSGKCIIHISYKPQKALPYKPVGEKGSQADLPCLYVVQKFVYHGKTIQDVEGHRDTFCLLTLLKEPLIYDDGIICWKAVD